MKIQFLPFSCIPFAGQPRLFSSHTFLDTDIVPEKLDLNKSSQTAGDLFGIELFQQRTIGDIGRDNGGQLCPQTVVQQAIEVRQEKIRAELCSQIV